MLRRQRAEGEVRRLRKDGSIALYLPGGRTVERGGGHLHLAFDDLKFASVSARS